jgi:uncharacterized RmlC-like cupin family protein
MLYQSNRNVRTHYREPRNDLPGEIYRWEKPVSEYAPISGLTRRLVIAPETCPTKWMSIWVVHLDRQKTNALDETFDIHDGVEEAIYGLKGRVKVFTPNESCILKPGGFVWIPAGMPHAARALQDRAVFIAVYAPARSGRSRNRVVSAQESKRIAREIVRKTASRRGTQHK